MEGVFIAEGPRLVKDLLMSGLKMHTAITTSESSAQYLPHDARIIKAHAREFKKITSMKQPQDILAVFHCRDHNSPKVPKPGTWAFALDQIQDPGNMGTILRTLDWFGFSDLYCAKGSVDIYNPKVVQASMGAIGRIGVQYVDLHEWLDEVLAASLPVYHAKAHGDPINDNKLTPGVMVLGNEGQGLSESVTSRSKQAVSIPRYGGGESLNVAVSCAVFASWFRMT